MNTCVNVGNLDHVFSPHLKAMWGRLIVLLALTCATLSLDKLNICMDGTHHKVNPSHEGQLYAQVQHKLNTISDS